MTGVHICTEKAHENVGRSRQATAVSGRCSDTNDYKQRRTVAQNETSGNLNRPIAGR